MRKFFMLIMLSTVFFANAQFTDFINTTGIGGVLFDNGYAYIPSDSKIFRYNEDGSTSSEVEMFNGQLFDKVSQMYSHGDWIYLVEHYGQKIWRFNQEDSDNTLELLVSEGLNYPTDVKVIDSVLYISDFNNDRIATIDLKEGFPQKPIDFVGVRGPNKMVLIGAKIYITSSKDDKVYSVLQNNPTAGLVTEVGSGLKWPHGMFADEEYVYVASMNSDIVVKFSIENPSLLETVYQFSDPTRIVYHEGYLYIREKSGLVKKTIFSPILGSVGVHDNEVAKLFPNPSTDYISVVGMDNFSGTIYNSLGEFVVQFSNKEQVDIIGLQEGVYFMDLGVEGVHKFVKK